MKLFAKGQRQPGAQSKTPAFSPIDRVGLLGLLDQVVNNGQSGVLELRETRGNWVYGFQGGALTHASGGRVRGARQAFDLLWEFQSGEFMFAPGVNSTLAGNLYIDKGRLLDLLRRSQTVLQGPSAPYIPPDQQRPITPAYGNYGQPRRGQVPPWQPGPQPGQYAGAPPGAPQGWPPAGQPGQPGMPPAPAWGAGGYPQQPAYPQAPYQSGAQYPGAQPQGPPQPPQGQPYPPQGYPQAPGQPQPGYPAYPQPMPPQQMPPQAQGMPPQMMPPAIPPQAPLPQARPARPVVPQSFSVPPMAIPKKREAIPSYQAPAAPMPAQPAPEPAKPTQPKDDLAALRASLVAQAPPIRPAPTAPTWGVRTGDGTVAPPPAATAKGKGKGKGKDRGAKAKGDSKLVASIKVQLITFLLWACERKYSPEDHWTLKDAFEVSTMELRDQFMSAFSQSLKSSTKSGTAEDDMDDMAAGRMRGRGRRH